MNQQGSIIKLGILISYDYPYIYTSLPLLYAHADEITIAIDKGRKMWSGKVFEFDEHVLTWIKEMDKDGKIKIYEDHFYQSGLTTMENDTRERNMLAAFMKPGGWHVQVDADEYFYDFDQFVQYLHAHDYYLDNPEQNPVDIAVFWLTLYKKTDKGFLYVLNSPEAFPVATNYPRYTYSRQNGYRWHHANFCVLHQSWARDEAEIQNWSHSADFNTADYFSFWKNINESNYRQHTNIHPVKGSIWKALGYAEGNTIDTFAKNYLAANTLKVPAFFFWKLKYKEWKRKGGFFKRKR
jgi:hypothetical protein